MTIEEKRFIRKLIQGKDIRNRKQTSQNKFKNNGKNC